MLFSVLIPVYNAEKYIEKTVQSILKQTEQDFEIVIMDDSSTDSSADVCRALAAKYKDKIRFFEQENKGVLLARRDLATLSRGEYLVFVDADDLLVENALELLKNTIVNTKSDLVLYDLQKRSKSGDELYTMPLENNRQFCGDTKKEVLRMMVLTKYIYSMCQKAFKRECFDFGADYSEYRGMRIGEDAFQSYPIMDKAKKITYLKEPIYIYRKNSTGATASVHEDDIRWHMMQFVREDEYISKWNIAYEDIKMVSATRLRKMLSFLSRIAKQVDKPQKYKEFKSLLKSIVNDKLFVNAVNAVDKKKLQKIYRLDLLLIRLRLYRLLYIEKRLI